MKLEERTNRYVNTINDTTDIGHTIDEALQRAIARISSNLELELEKQGINWSELKIIPKGCILTEKIIRAYHPFAEISEGDLRVQDLVTGEKLAGSSPAYCEIQAAKDKPNNEPLEEWEVREPKIPSKQTWYLPCLTAPLKQALEVQGEFYKTRTTQAKDDITVMQTDRLRCEQKLEFPISIELVGAQAYRTIVGQIPDLELKLEESETEYEGKFRHDFEKPHFEYTRLRRVIGSVYKSLLEKRHAALSLGVAISGGLYGFLIGNSPSTKGLLSVAGAVAFPAVIASIVWGILNVAEAAGYGISRIIYGSDREKLRREICRTITEIEKMKQQHHQLPTEEKIVVPLRYETK